MQIEPFKKTTITLFDNEVDTMRQIIRLAHERLQSAPATQMRGVPMERRAGLVGPELIRTQEMIASIANATGLELKEIKPSNMALIVAVLSDQNLEH